jgi:hypothetical protein
MPDKSEHEYRGWEIRITDKPVNAEFSALIEVRRPGQTPHEKASTYVEFQKRAASLEEARAAALQTAKKWIDKDIE